ncbi:MAG: ParB/RepB/Spo0J family partition protein [Pseudomonadota bacterium]
MTTKAQSSKKRGLGMGLSALLGADAENYKQAPTDGRILNIPIECLKPSPLQPRRHFDKDELTALAQSIAQKGMLQPLVVRPINSALGTYEIIAGERRWRAAQEAGLAELPATPRDLDDREVIEVALIENIQRQSLSPLEEADAYHRLIETHGHTQEAVAQAVGKSRSHIANTLRLRSLPEEIVNLLGNGSLSAGHARALLSSETPLEHAQLILSGDLSVRATESLVKRACTIRTSKPQKPVDPNVTDLETRVSAHLGLPVAIKPRGKGGILNIRYTNTDQLNALLDRLG